MQIMPRALHRCLLTLHTSGLPGCLLSPHTLHTTAGVLQLHRLSTCLLLSVQLMLPILSTFPYHSRSWTGPRSHCLCLYFQKALALNEVSKSSTQSHSAHLSQQCWQNCLLHSCISFRANIHQLTPRCELHKKQNSAAAVQLFMARASPEPPDSLSYHS